MESFIYAILGLGGIFYAYQCYHWPVNPLDYFPGRLKERKLAFAAGFAIVICGFIASWFIGKHSQLISLTGTWFMLLGSSFWFHQRCLRRAFAPSEWKIIRITLFSGFGISVFSTGIFWLPCKLSLGTVFMGIALMLLAGRLWWLSDPNRQA